MPENETSSNDHPFINKSAFEVVFCSNFTFYDAKGRVVCSLLKNAYPKEVASRAAKILKHAAKRTSLRAGIYGGVSPQSGIAGYYDYFGSPVDEKCRKTSFTADHFRKWGDVFPLVEYVNLTYQKLHPESWKRQDAAIPDIVRIRKSVFSTLTINEKFRTAKHKDTGDFEHGLGAMSVLQGVFGGLYLGFPDFGFCVDVQPRDVVLFNTHVFHCNTELEHTSKVWSRISCVFYFRTNLASKRCLEVYRQRSGGFDAAGDTFDKCGKALENPSEIVGLIPRQLNPVSLLVSHSQFKCDRTSTRKFTILEEWMELNRAIWGRAGPDLETRSPQCFKSQESVLNDGTERNCLTLKKLVESKVDYLKSLSRIGISPEIIKEWEERKRSWLSHIHQSRRSGRILWSNTGALNQAFFALCDVANRIFNAIVDGAKAGKPEKSNFNMLLAVHLRAEYHRTFKVKDIQLSLKKIIVKIHDYEFGGTRYKKDMPFRQTDCSSSSSEDSAESSLDDAGEYDYQTEDFEFDYAKHAIPHPNKILCDTFIQRQSAHMDESEAPLSPLTVLIVQPGSPNIPQEHNDQHDGEWSPSVEYRRLKECFLTQQASQHMGSRQWQSNTEVNIVELPAELLQIDRLRDLHVDAVVVHHATPSLSDSERETLFEELKKLDCPLIVHTFVSEDPEHYLLRPRVQEEYNCAINALYAKMTGISEEKHLWSSAQWCAFFRKSVGEVIGTYSLKGAALNDTFVVISPY